MKFAELCAKPSFRMHLRTESALERVIDLLKDAPEVPVCISSVSSLEISFFFQSLNLCLAFILYVLSFDTLTSGITTKTVHLMIELVQKSSSKTEINDEEYKKMKTRILNIANQSIQEEIFYEQRFNVSSDENLFMAKSISFVL